MPEADVPVIRWPAPVEADEWARDYRIRGVWI
jgi:hypothetical protein